MQAVYLKLIEGLRDYFGLYGFKKAVLGLSGGIDSALTLKLVADALKPQNVTAIHMPELGLTSRVNSEHAEGLAKFLGVNYLKIPINRYLDIYGSLPWDRSDLSLINVKARVRATILYDFANSNQVLVVGTSNKSELMLGYGTKFGDLAADLEAIGDLYKTEVYKLAKFLGLPEEILVKPPSAELFLGQTDELELGASYELIDQILMAKQKNYNLDHFDQILVRRVENLIKQNKHKNEMPFLVKAS